MRAWFSCVRPGHVQKRGEKDIWGVGWAGGNEIGMRESLGGKESSYLLRSFNLIQKVPGSP